MPRRGRRASRVAAALLAVLAAGCTPARPPAAPPAGSEIAGEIPPLTLAAEPEGYAGRTIVTRGWLVASGPLPGGAWLELASSEPGRGGATPADVLRLTARKPDLTDALQELNGKELAIALQVGERSTLGDGRSAIAVTVLQAFTRDESPVGRDQPGMPAAVRPESNGNDAGAGSPALDPSTREAALERAKEFVRRQSGSRAAFFRDPELTSGSGQPDLRIKFLDPNAARPEWYLPGPTTIEKSGPEDAPAYRVTSVTRSDDGRARESDCRFQVEERNLRSVAYDERIRAADGKVLEEQHLDFVSGKYLDKITGDRLPWPRNIYAAPCLGIALSGFPVGDKRAVQFFLWSEYDPATPMDAIADSKEWVAVPAGNFQCYRLRMNANPERIVNRLALPSQMAQDLALAVATQSRQQDTVFWVNASWPHIVVRTEATMGPPGTSRAVIDLVEVDEATRAAMMQAVQPPDLPSP